MEPDGRMFNDDGGDTEGNGADGRKARRRGTTKTMTRTMARTTARANEMTATTRATTEHGEHGNASDGDRAM